MAIAVRDVEPRAAEILDEVERAVIGKRPQIELVLMGLLADGHVLIEDFPGLAKTLIARSVARVCSMRFSRIQFTPDLMPSDVTGSAIYDQRDAVFRFQPGPVFANLLLADEINRAPPKTQAALLEAMQEQQVTADGHTHPLERPFIVLATQNPIEYEGTYPLPEAQLDRFLMRVSIGYPARDDERRLLLERAERRADAGRASGRLRPGDAARASAGGRGGARLRADRLVHGRHRGGHARRAADPGRRLAARFAGAAQARALARRRSRAGTSSPPRT